MLLFGLSTVFSVVVGGAGSSTTRIRSSQQTGCLSQTEKWIVSAHRVVGVSSTLDKMMVAEERNSRFLDSSNVILLFLCVFLDFTSSTCSTEFSVECKVSTPTG